VRSPSARAWVLLLLAGSGLALGPSHAVADAPCPVLARMLGRYVNVAADGGRAHIEARTDAVVAELRPAIRGIGRRHILRNNLPIRALVIDYVDGEVVVEYVGQHRRYHAPLGGPAVENSAPDGSSVDVRYRMRGDVLVEDMRARRGGAVSTYRLCPVTGELQLTTRVSSGSLPRDIVYEHVLRGPTRDGRSASAGRVSPQAWTPSVARRSPSTAVDASKAIASSAVAGTWRSRSRP